VGLSERINFLNTRWMSAQAWVKGDGIFLATKLCVTLSSLFS